jgi:CspA family cold shock protein
MTIIGTVKFFNTEKGFGFIAPETGGQDAFVHISAVERAGLRTPSQNQRVSYVLEPDHREDQRSHPSAARLTAIARAASNHRLCNTSNGRAR